MEMNTQAADRTVSSGSVETFLRKRWLGIPLAVYFLAVIVLAAALLRLVNLESVGDGNLYYAAAVKSMLVSWKNFFFVAAEPGGSVTVDKPPLGLWAQALSAAVFGVNTFGLMLPQILAGLGSMVLVYILVRRWAGEGAGLLAAFILAVTPVSIAVERNNTMDAQLVFMLLLAVWMFVLAAEQHPGFLLLGGLLIGLAFNIKMLQAYLPVPFLFVYYFLAGRQRWQRRLLYILLTGLVILVVSFSWVVVVDSIPEENRPYIGSSEDNTVMELIFGHNGLNRLFGRRGADSLLSSLFGSDTDEDGAVQQAPAIQTLPIQSQADQPPRKDGPLPQGGRPQNNTGSYLPGRHPDGTFPQQGQVLPNGEGVLPPAAALAARSPDNQVGNNEIGEPGFDRLFTLPLGNEISWLLPFGLGLILVLAVSSPITMPLSEDWSFVVLWGGWLLACAVFFSFASFFHRYYLAMLAPPLAAGIAGGLERLWRKARFRSWTAASLLVLSSGTLMYQIHTAYSYSGNNNWIWAAVLMLASGILAEVIGIMAGKKWLQKAGFVFLAAAVLIAPVIWSIRTTFVENPHTGLPGAYAGERENRQVSNDLEKSPNRLQFLMDQTADMEYLLAVPGSMQGAEYVLASGRPVLYIGGFNGGDPVLTLEEFQGLIENGRLRFVLLSGENNQSENAEIFQWVRTSCTAVPFNAAAEGNQLPAAQQRPLALFDCIGIVDG